MRTILIVEDDPVLRNLLEHALTGRYSLSYAANGEDAIAAITSTAPDLILLDLLLPGGSGFSVLEHVRALPDARKNTPVIIVSNLSQESDRHRAEALGATTYLVKAEVAVDTIIETVERYLPGDTQQKAA